MDCALRIQPLGLICVHLFHAEDQPIPHACPPSNPSQGILAEELAGRLAEQEVDHQRHARTLALHYTGGSGFPKIGDRSVRCAMPQHGKGGPNAKAIATSAVAVLRWDWGFT